MLAPEIIIKNVVVEGGGKRVEVSNPHIASEQEGSISTDSGLYTVTLNFSVIDQYNNSGLGSWIENQDVRKYIKFLIRFNPVQNPIEFEPLFDPMSVHDNMNINYLGEWPFYVRTKITLEYF